MTPGQETELHAFKTRRQHTVGGCTISPYSFLVRGHELQAWIARIEWVPDEAPMTRQIDAESLPGFALSDKEAQRLVDDLWDLGYRPTEGVGSAGSLAATRKHLEDMRAIAFKTTGVEKPE